MSGCLGAVAAALVDGELAHAARERAHRHLAHCAGCRAEVEAQRRLKTRMAGLSGPAPTDALTARLLGLAAPAPEARLLPSAGSRDRPAPVAARPVSVRPAAGPGGAPAPAGRARRSSTLRRRAAAGSALAVLGVATALALGSPPARPASTPVDPGTDAFVTQFVDTTSDAATVTRASLTTTGGAGSDR